MRKILKQLFIFSAIAAIVLPGVVIKADDDVRPDKIVKIKSTDSTIRVGTNFELKAITSPINAEDDNLRWSIIGKKGIIRFDDADRNDDDAEFKAIKAGTTKVRCAIRGKGLSGSKTYTVTVKGSGSSSSKGSVVAKKTVVVEDDDDFELKAKKFKNANSSNLKWSIKNKRIVNFDDGDCYGYEVELDALRIGKTVVICKNTKTNDTIRFTVRVVSDDDDDDDDDD